MWKDISDNSTFSDVSAPNICVTMSSDTASLKQLFLSFTPLYRAAEYSFLR